MDSGRTNVKGRSRYGQHTRLFHTRPSERGVVHERGRLRDRNSTKVRGDDRDTSNWEVYARLRTCPQTRRGKILLSNQGWKVCTAERRVRRQDEFEEGKKREKPPA